jgi:hypothetical protein
MGGDNPSTLQPYNLSTIPLYNLSTFQPATLLQSPEPLSLFKPDMSFQQPDYFESTAFCYLAHDKCQN